MKTFKIRVPENDGLPVSIDGAEIKAINIYRNQITGYYHITRAGIHELVQKHARELGYKVNKNFLSNSAPWVQVDSKMYTLEFPYNDKYYPQYQEIAWQDFLKLTKTDVMDETQINENLQSSNKNDRNEKAWEILNSLISGGYYQYSTSGGETKVVDWSFDLADEFLKHAGKP